MSMVNGELITRTLLEKGLSDEKLAAALSCSLSTIRTMKRGGKVRESYVYKAANALDLNVSDLILKPTPDPGGPQTSVG